MIQSPDKKIQFILSLLIIMIFIPIGGSLPTVQAEAPLNLEDAVFRQEQRFRYVNLESVINSLGITDGMTILDIGANVGLAAITFAEKLHGTGEVFTTDVRNKWVDYISDEAQKRGLNNLHPVLVKKDGLDDFYGKHRFDLVFLSNIYHLLENRIDYFSRLRGCLKPDARLVLINYNQVPLVTPDELSNFDSLVESLSRENPESPFVKLLSLASKQYLKDKGNMRKESETFKRVLVEDFNRMLTDPRFYNQFYKNSYFTNVLLTPPERDLANWLLMSLKEDGVLEIPGDQIDAKSMRTVIKLNRLFFNKHFEKYLARGHKGIGAYFPASDANRHTSKYVMMRELDAAGYKFAQEIKVSLLFDVVIMVPKTP